MRYSRIWCSEMLVSYSRWVVFFRCKALFFLPSLFVSLPLRAQVGAEKLYEEAIEHKPEHAMVAPLFTHLVIRNYYFGTWVVCMSKQFYFDAAIFLHQTGDPGHAAADGGGEERGWVGVACQLLVVVLQWCGARPITEAASRRTTSG